MSGHLGKAIDGVRDGEDNAIEFDAAYPVHRRLPAAIDELRRLHGNDFCLLPISGASCGGGIFQMPRRPPGPVLGLSFDPPPRPRIGFASEPALVEIELDQILIDRERQCINAGAAVTLEQLKEALAQELGPAFRVPGADLTSYQYAAAGATFMTGGMGPQRRYFSDSVIAAAIFDGENLTEHEGEALSGYAGTYGWSGIVTALRCRYRRFPENELAFALPISHQPQALARLLDRLAPYCYLELDADTAASQTSANLILGIEHVSTESMQPLLARGGDEQILARANDLRHKCAEAGAAGLLFVNALCLDAADDFLIGLCDETDAAEPTIGGVAIEHAEMFGDSEQMRNLREAIPYAARLQHPGADYLYKNHSDANVRIAPDRVAPAVERLWRISCDYVARVEAHLAAARGVSGSILVYGHLNPCGFDPHNRVTLCADDAAEFARSRDFLREARAEYYREFARVCADGDGRFIGGEKTADSEIAIYAALGGPQNAPAELAGRFLRQRETVAKAQPMFNWRALEPYV